MYRLYCSEHRLLNGMINLSKLGFSRRTRAFPLLCGVGFCAIFLVLRNGHKRIDQTVIDVDKWIENPTTICGGHFTGYGSEFAVLRNARVDRTKKVFSIPCENKTPKYTFLYGKEGTILQEWMDNLQAYPNLEVSDDITTNMATVVVMRYEAHNLYHTLCEWYNVFIVTKLLNIDPEHTDILFMDDRPRSLLDNTWDILFGNVNRSSDLSSGIVFKNLIWNVIGYESPVNFHNLQTLPYMEDFYNFFIRSFSAEKHKTLDCKKLDVTIIWRRDYMTHPERQQETGGLVHRKFRNEDEILSIVKDLFLGHTVKDVVLEEINMKDQVKLFTNTDLLVGMHGAGMAYTMFLPKHAAVFETFPNYWGFLRHFKAFARWRGIKYLGWQNTDPNNEFENFYTRIPPEVLRSHLQQLKSYLCPA